jgi:hypothetical protein
MSDRPWLIILPVALLLIMALIGFIFAP